jgi:hypothetical protein
LEAYAKSAGGKSMKCGNKLCKYNDDYYRDNCRNTEHAELARQCMKNNFNHYEPADLPGAGASAERISSVVRSNATTGWISVKDRLPNVKEVCLVYAYGFVLIAHYLGNDYWNHGYYPNRIYPSHWMALPDAPEV